jgi:hypothetical protein
VTGGSLPELNDCGKSSTPDLRGGQMKTLHSLSLYPKVVARTFSAFQKVHRTPNSMLKLPTCPSCNAPLLTQSALAAILPSRSSSVRCACAPLNHRAVLWRDGPRVVAGVAMPCQLDRLAMEGVFEADGPGVRALWTHLRDPQFKLLAHGNCIHGITLRPVPPAERRAGPHTSCGDEQSR